MIEVQVEGPDKNIQTLSFDKSSIMVGRSEANDIPVNSDDVSRYHARISIDDSKVYLQDLESTNGTFMNGVQIVEAILSPEDEIIMGEYTLRIRFISQVEDTDIYNSGEKDSLLVSFNPECSEEPVKEAIKEPHENELGQGALDLGGEVSIQEGMAGFYWDSLKTFLAPVWAYIIDDSVSEIMINGERDVYIESKGRLSRVDARFSKPQLDAAVLNIAQYVGRRLGDNDTYLDARLPDGSRVAVLLPPCSRKGVAIAIRKFSQEALTFDKLLQFGSLSPEMISFLHACVVLKKNLLISGGTSSGKTSLLNVISGFISSDERIITIEDSAELQLCQEHVLPMETKPSDKKGEGQVTIRDLVRASLRMRPDRIVVGEIRGGEAIDLLQAMNTGHSGSMTTVHASSPLQALTRLETLALFSGLDIPIRALREQVTSAIDVIVQAARLPDHSRKVTNISVIGATQSDGSYQVHDVYRYTRTGMKEGKLEGRHEWSGYIPDMIKECELAGLSEVLENFSAHYDDANNQG